MKTSFRILVGMWALAWAGSVGLRAEEGVQVVEQAQQAAVEPAPVTTEPTTVAPSQVEAPASTSAHVNDEHAAGVTAAKPTAEANRTHTIVSWFSDAVFEGDVTREVVAFFGDVRVNGTVGGDVVAVFGDVTLAGEARQDVVAVFGNVVLDGPAGGQVTSVFGNVGLGPKTRVNRDVIAVGGRVLRDSEARVRGQVSEVAFFGTHDARGFRAWLREGVIQGRPLTLVAEARWAWFVAGTFLALYLAIAWVARGAVARCVETLETRPGLTLLATFLTVLIAPLLLVVSAVTVIGPVLLLLCGVVAMLVGKAAVLAWLGRSALRPVMTAAPGVVTTLVGGVLLAFVYLVPVLGFVAWATFTVLGTGLAIYAVLVALQRERPAVAAPSLARVQPAATPVVPVTEPPVLPAPAVDASGADVEAPIAGFGVRMAALALDVFLVWFVVGNLNPRGQFFYFLSLAAYTAILWKLKGTTVGGVICGLRVVRADGRALDWPTAVVRSLGCFLSAVVFGLGFLWVLFDPRSQAWHDKVAGTIVVKPIKPRPLV